MFINAFAAVILLVSPAVIAAPGAPVRNPQIKLCIHASSVNCVERDAPIGSCEEMLPDWNDAVTYLDTYNKKCDFYVLSGCTDLAFSHTGKIEDINKSDYSLANDAISSYRCA